MRTRLTDVLDIEHPVMLAGMGGVSYADLVVAVSEAGGFGCLGASTMSDAELDAQMADVRSRTAKPYGVDLLTAAGDQTEKVERIIAAGATVYVAGLGVPREVIDLCHAQGVLVMNMCGKVRHAIDAVEAREVIILPNNPNVVLAARQVASMTEEFEGEDVLHPRVRAHFDEAKAMLVELHEKLQKYTGPFELPEPDEELRAIVQHIVDNEVRHVPTR